MQIRHLLPIAGLLVTVAHSYPSQRFQDKCASLANAIQLDYPFTVNIVEYLAPNATIDYEAEGLNATCAGNVAYPIPVGVCRLNLRVNTTEKSEIYMEVWLPENWKGRVLTTGNGGLAGCIGYREIAYGASYGFASFGTNAGHNGTSGGAFYHQPDVLEDFSWRAVYTGAVVGKSITKQFYGEDCGKSYYIGCSTGGRQGWKAVQQNPEIFDGVITGAPAIDFFRHVAWFGYAFEINGWDVNNTLLSIEQWAGVQAEALKQCDDLDGAHDGIIEDPTACKFDWDPLLCSNNASATCLNTTQVEGASKLFAPITYNGTYLHPGHYQGYEKAAFEALYTPEVSGWIPEGFRYVFYQNLSWDPTTFTLADATFALEQNLFNLQTLDHDISGFRDRGGKVLHWHGQADQLLAGEISRHYYGKVQEAMNATVEELDEFYRFFRASGVNHCGGGPGASFMGQLGEQAAADDPDDNMLLRIVEWVENNNPPEFVRGTKFFNDTPELGVEFTRKHCKYPKHNVYKGTGNGTDESGWECVEP